MYHSARLRSPEARAALLRQADPELRREVESLLAQDALPGPMERRAVELLEDSTLTQLAAGAQLGPYRIEALLGAGGMGQVYRATDTRLGRQVAIKTSAERFSDRFEREAHAIAALNHPNICTLYDVGPDYLVMELVEGETLAECLKKGAVPAEQALRFGIEIAGALAEAHARGIVHRDLKPGNIMTTRPASGPAGIKVLDFGLAKMADAPGDTLTATRQVMGTPAYMAPEQREGQPCDWRADIYALGLILYEMFTGKRFAPGEEPVAEGLPHAIISKCLENDRELRYQHAAEIGTDLQRLKRDTESGRVTTGARRGAATATAKRRKVMIPAAAVLALVGSGYFYLHGKPKLTDKDTLVLADFENKTGDPVFDGTLRQGLAVQLEQSPFLSLIAEERIQHVLGLMGQPKDTRLTPPIAKEICERAGSAAVVDGSIASLGSQYVLGLRAKNCRTGYVLDEEQAQAAKKEDVLDALSQIASRFRSRIGESLATVEMHDTPLPEATTPSLEALKAYGTASQVWFSTGPAASLPHLQRAIEIDPQFAMAHAWLGRVYAELWEPVLAAESANRAYQLRNRVSDPERFFIMVPHDLDVTGNLERARQTAELWAETYPRDVRPRGYLSWIDQQLGKYEKSVEDGKKAVALDPNFPPGYNNLAWAYVQLDRLPEAENTLQQASEHKVAFPEFLVMRYYIAYLRGDPPGMQRVAAQSEGNADVGDWIFHAEACVLAYSGHLQEARRKSRRAVDSARQAPHKRERAAMWQAGAAVREAFFGNATEARQYAAAALDFSKGRDVEYGAALALALVGDAARSQALAKDLEKASEDTYVRFNYLPTLRALWALSQGGSSNAIELLQIAGPYELGVGSAATGLYGILYPVYARGQAYQLAHRYTEAAAEFQRILDYPGIVFADPVGVMARLQLAKSFALSGDTAKAKAAYQDFLTLWKDADPDIPILQQAKAEYARLP